MSYYSIVADFSVVTSPGNITSLLSTNNSIASQAEQNLNIHRCELCILEVSNFLLATSEFRSFQRA
jgi:hypothetical protein